jgi:hypothetical protein
LGSTTSGCGVREHLVLTASVCASHQSRTHCRHVSSPMHHYACRGTAVWRTERPCNRAQATRSIRSRTNAPPSGLPDCEGAPHSSEHTLKCNLRAFRAVYSCVPCGAGCMAVCAFPVSKRCQGSSVLKHGITVCSEASVAADLTDMLSVSTSLYRIFVVAGLLSM